MKYVDVPKIRRWLDLAEDIISDDAEIEDAIDAVEREVEQNICYRTFEAPDASSSRIFAGGGMVIDGFVTIYVDDAASFTLVEQSNDRASWSTVTGWWDGPDDDPVKYRIHHRVPFASFVRVTAAFGYPGGPPPELIQAIKVRVAAALDRRNSANGIAGEGQFGISRVSRFTDPDVERWTRPLVRFDRACNG